MSGLKRNYYGTAEKLLVAVDCIIFGFDEKEIKLLLFKRKFEPFKGRWSLVGGFVGENEDVDQAASRILKDYVGLENIFLQQLKGYGKADRDPGGRVVSFAFSALIPLKHHEIEIVESYQAHWFSQDEIPNLILDHNEMLQDAIENLRIKAQRQPIGFELLPEKFTLPQLKTLYDNIYQTNLDSRNFRKKILSLNVLKKLDEKDKSGSKKGAFLYQFDAEKYEKMVKSGFDFQI
ncbi:MAG TPA: NUDIX domain-containing protein [Saprospiraceae bacterium]|nr:NUDIX domain-containing protein [Saprospiraceae bacterium]HMQ84825.1 NUDIX domain-containing protein [Saprospiraceae bacterium]